MSDIAKALRLHAYCESHCDAPSGVDLSLEAADEIERLRARVAELEAQRRKFREALELLVDHQNGCPLPKYEAEWTRAMALARVVLAETAP